MTIAADARAFALIPRRLHVPLASLALRLASLVGKFGLSIFIARYLSLAELGAYGIIFAVSMFMIVLLGGRIDHELGRQFVAEPAATRARLLRDEAAFFALTATAALPLFVAAGSLGLSGFGMGLAICTWAICALESYANILFFNANALGKSLIANLVFFVRAGAWAFVAMALLMAVPGARSLWTVLLLWVAGSALSIVLSIRLIDDRRWPSFREAPVDWPRLKAALRVSFLIWIGSIGLAGGTYLDRIILSGYLDLETVGVATFYTSFSSAVVTLVSSSCLGVVLAKLVGTAQAGDWTRFGRELRAANRSVVMIGVPICLIIAVLLPYSGFVLHKPQFFSHRVALWLLMAATMVRLLAESAYTGLYALRLDRPIWIGNLAFLAFSVAANTVSIALFGLVGLGLANIIAALFLLTYRLWSLQAFTRVHWSRP